MTIPKRILIVDDDPGIHRLLDGALHSEDRQIDSSFNGDEALAKIKTVPYDLVLADVQMPGMNGLALLECIRRICPATKVLVMTVENSPDNIVRAIRKHAFSFFSKPFPMSSFAEMVKCGLKSTEWEDDIEVTSAQLNWIGLHLRCKVEAADRIVQFLRELASDLSQTDQENLATALREILMNAIEHGGGSDPRQKVTVTYVRGSRSLIYYVRDPGPGFSFEDLSHAAVSNPPDSPFEHADIRERMGLRPGGFGILLTRKLVDELIYNETGNEVLLIKYLPDAVAG